MAKDKKDKKGKKGKAPVSTTGTYMEGKLPMRITTGMLSGLEKAGAPAFYLDDWFRPPGGGAPVVAGESANNLRKYRATGNPAYIGKAGGRLVGDFNKGTFGDGKQADQVQTDAMFLFALAQKKEIDKKDIKKLDKVAARLLDLAGIG